MSSKVTDSKIMSHHSNFNMYRCDRQQRRCSGVLIGGDKSIPSRAISIKYGRRMVWIYLQCSFRSVLVAVCYRPLDAPPLFTDIIQDDLSLLSKKYLILPGDLSVISAFHTLTSRTLHLYALKAAAFVSNLLISS